MAAGPERTNLYNQLSDEEKRIVWRATNRSDTANNVSPANRLPLPPGLTVAKSPRPGLQISKAPRTGLGRGKRYGMGKRPGLLGTRERAALPQVRRNRRNPNPRGRVIQPDFNETKEQLNRRYKLTEIKDYIRNHNLNTDRKVKVSGKKSELLDRLINIGNNNLQRNDFRYNYQRVPVRRARGQVAARRVAARQVNRVAAPSHERNTARPSDPNVQQAFKICGNQVYKTRGSNSYFFLINGTTKRYLPPPVPGKRCP